MELESTCFRQPNIAVINMLYATAESNDFINVISSNVVAISLTSWPVLTALKGSHCLRNVKINEIANNIESEIKVRIDTFECVLS